MALIWIDESEITKVQWFHALSFEEYKRVCDNKDQIKKFLELRLGAIRNTILQSKEIAEWEIPALLKWIRLVESQIIPVLMAMKSQIEEKDLQEVKD